MFPVNTLASRLFGCLCPRRMHVQSVTVHTGSFSAAGYYSYLSAWRLPSIMINNDDAVILPLEVCPRRWVNLCRVMAMGQTWFDFCPFILPIQVQCTHRPPHEILLYWLYYTYRTYACKCMHYMHTGLLFMNAFSAQQRGWWRGRGQLWSLYSGCD